MTADAVSEALAQTEAQCDAVVSFAGLPPDLEELSIYQLESPPKVAAFFTGKAVNLDAIRRWLKDDLLQAAVVRDGGRLRLYTRTDLP
jgi:myo-inositol catabolism protein IolC